MSKRPKTSHIGHGAVSKPAPKGQNVGNPQEHHAYDTGIIAKARKVFGETMTTPRKKS